MTNRSHRWLLLPQVLAEQDAAPWERLAITAILSRGVCFCTGLWAERPVEHFGRLMK